MTEEEVSRGEETSSEGNQLCPKQEIESFGFNGYLIQTATKKILFTTPQKKKAQ